MLNSRSSLVIFILLILLTAAPILAESGSANYSVSKTMLIAGTEIKAGEYQVKYQSNSPEVTVTVKSNGKVVATVKGKLEKLTETTDYNSLLVGKDSAGRDIIAALQFGGKKYRVVFE
jgi:ABC-type dipeptide/oligopeptide/nickel transport system permease subunit